MPALSIARCLLCGLLVAATTQPAAADGAFVDHAADLGLDFSHINGMDGTRRYLAEIMGPGGALFDADADGDLDIYLVQGGSLDETAPPVSDRLYRNQLAPSGRLGFVDATRAAGIAAYGYGMGVAVGDTDNDGLPDLYVSNFGPNQLWRNNGDGTFVDDTAASGAQNDRWSTSAAFFDYDGDGWLDLFVGNYVDFSLANHKTCYSPAGIPDYCSPLAYRPLPNRLWRNRGDGTFADVSTASRTAGAYGGALGVVAADFNGDGRPDLYVANDGRPNLLWLNQGDGTFVEDALLRGAAVNGQGAAEAGMGVDAADFDGDGDDDLFVTHLDQETNTLYRNDGTGQFEDDTFTVGLGPPSRGLTGFGTAWLDYDLDGRLDLMIANGAVRINESQALAGDKLPLRQPNQLLRYDGRGAYRDVTKAAGAAFGLAEVSRGLAVGDVDNDGDPDVLLLNNNGPVRLLINQRDPDAAWLGLRLRDGPQGRDLYGTRVGCVLADGPTLWRTVRAASSYCSSNDPRILLGLVPGHAVDRLEIHWPDGSAEHWDGADLTPGRYHTLYPGAGRPLR